LTQAVLIAASYVLGAVPFGLLAARWWKGIDLREHGSGNIGATNVFRTVGRTAGTIVFVLDVLKGFAPPTAAALLGLEPAWQVAAGLAAITGHNASPFLGFKGGKGVSTSLGVLFGVAWKVGAAAWALWAVLVLFTGYISVGSIAAAIALTPLTLLLYPGDTARLLFAVAAGAFSIYKHRANIERLRNGTEPSFRKRPARQRTDDER